MLTALTAERLWNGTSLLDHPVVAIEEGRIASISTRSAGELPARSQACVLDYPGSTLAPAFLDVHIHGAAGHDVMEATPGALSTINRELIGKAEALDSPPRVVLDMDSTEIPVYGQQENSAYNGHFESTCYHPLLLFNREGDCLAAKLRPGNVHSADDWEELLLPEIERQQKLDLKDGGWMYTDTHQEAKKEIPVKGLSEVWRILRQAGGHTRLREQHGSTSSGH
ncbi:MAG: transposase [Terracidiphilus sp.]|jgi:hypothetical protein